MENRMTTSTLLPPDVAARTSRWFGRARNYPIFSAPWYRHRSVAMLSGIALVIGAFLALGGWSRLGPRQPIDVGKAREGGLAYFVTAAAICLVGPGLAVLVRRRGLGPWRETLAIACVLGFGIASGGVAWKIAVDAYARPAYDSRRDVVVRHVLTGFDFHVDVRGAQTQRLAGLRDPAAAARYAAAYERYARAFNLPDRLRDGLPAFFTQDDRRLLAAVRQPGGLATHEARYVALLEKMADGTIDLIQRARGRHGKAPLTPAQQAASDALAGELQAAPLPLSAEERIASRRAGEFAGFVMALGALALIAWLGGLFDLFAFIRQRGMLGDAHARQELERARAARAGAETRLSVLAAQVEPHFLFNTLAGVRSALATDPARAAQIVDHMTDYLRASIPQMRDEAVRNTVPLARQLDAARSYLALMHERMGRLQYGVAAEPGLERASIPPLMLISLVENAVRHGAEPKTGPVRIDVRARRRDVDGIAMLEVAVADDGAGFGNATAGGGLGLANIQQRLRDLFGGQASLQLKAGTDGGVTATLLLPLAFEP
jgi:hypothetical protein